MEEYCYDEKHETPCKLPCVACEEDCVSPSGRYVYTIDVSRIQTFQVEAPSVDEALTLVLDGNLIDDNILDISIIQSVWADE